VRIVLLAFVLAAASVEAQTTVAIDVGHYLEEPGAISARGRAELEFNRDLALEIDSAVLGKGLGSFLIGFDGLMARLSARAVAGASAGFLLSVHHDSVQPHFLETWVHEGGERLYCDRYSGFSLFVSRKGPFLRRSLACASAIGEEMRRAGFPPSLYHADPIPGERKPFADKLNGVHYYDNLIVLKTARTPAVLLEAGVILNRAEELEMQKESVHRRIAAAVAAGLDRCLPGGAARTAALRPL
jgi:N-acetylmuramoyl-L-alanine amidase